MTSIAAHVEAARRERAKLDPATVALTLLMVVPFVIGWVVRKIVAVFWLVGSWLWTSAVVGWRAAAPKREPGT